MRNADSRFTRRIELDDVVRIVEQLRDQGLLTEEVKSLLVHDLDRMVERLQCVRAAFPANALHTLAIKANPLVAILAEAVQWGFGLEAASMEEVHLALAARCPPERIVFDSPAKTVAELEEALGRGVYLNANSMHEVRRIATIRELTESSSPIGLRINPNVGAGQIRHTSVSTAGTQFGEPLDQQEEILALFARYDWLTGLHCHVGSQGYDVSCLIEGICRMADLAATIEAQVGRPLDYWDLGGGLPTAYSSAHTPPSVAQYAAALAARVPTISDQRRVLITEFGRSIQAGCGFAISRVEYVLPDRNICVSHLGADLLVRPVYASNDWSHEFFVLDAEGHPKQGSQRPITITGPLCFSGDVIARDISLPPVSEGDLIIIRDTGAYTLSMWSRHCSRGMPATVGIRAGTAEILKRQETPADVVRHWNG